MRNRVFTDEKKLETMFELRKKGFSLISLGVIFGVDYTTIYHHLKHKKIIKTKNELQFSIPNILLVTDLNMRRPKSYAEYLMEEKRRKTKFYPNYLKLLS